MPDLCDARYIRETLARYGFHFSKAFGQNFLVDSAVPEKIAGFVDSGSAVLEIGPGFGALTAALCEKAAHVVAVEKDRLLLPVLRENLSGRANLSLVEGDALVLDLEALMPAGIPRSVCSNLPYSVTSPLLTKLLEAPSFDRIVVMVQREVAMRICAAPGTAEYGAFTLFSDMYASAEILFEVGPESFTPRPAVTSAVIRLTRHTTPVVSDKKTYQRVVRAAFSQRRKTLQNALSSGLAMPRHIVADALTRAGIPPSVRGETLGREEYLRLTAEFAGLIHRL